MGHTNEYNMYWMWMGEWVAIHFFPFSFVCGGGDGSFDIFGDVIDDEADH